MLDGTFYVNSSYQVLFRLINNVYTTNILITRKRICVVISNDDEEEDAAIQLKDLIFCTFLHFFYIVCMRVTYVSRKIFKLFMLAKKNWGFLTY